MVGNRMTTELIGREHEMSAIGAFADEARRGPVALVIAGDPGIGKTVLWGAAVADARRRCKTVLACRTDAGEAAMSFTGLSDLVGEGLEEALGGLAPPRRSALEVALLLDEPETDPPDPRAVALGFLDIMRARARVGPVLVAVDDLQWLDQPTAQVLQFALRRLRAEPVGFLATLRTAPGSASSLALDRWVLAERPPVVLTPGPLALGALYRLLRDRLSLELPRPQLVRLREVTAGNPFYALELGRELLRTQTGAAVARSLPVPRTLTALLGERIARLPAATRKVVLATAALSRPTVTVLSAAFGDASGVQAGLDRAAAEGVVELDGSRVAFTHPLLGSVCYESAPSSERRAVHRILATAVGDVEERARHLALASEGRDAAVATELDAAAAAAVARGAPAAAAELSELAAQLTPSEGRPERRRRLRAAELHRLAGDRGRAATLLERLLADTRPGLERADVLFALARARRADLPRIAALCDEALALAADGDARCAEILAFRSWMHLLAGRVRDALSDARAALERAERAREPVLLARAIARVAMAETWTLDITPGLLERGAIIEERLDGSLEFHESPDVTLGRRLMCQSRFDAAVPHLERARRRAEARGDEGSRGHVLFHLFQVEWFTGRWARASEYVAMMRELADLLGDRQYRAISLYAQALLDAHLGRVPEAHAAAEEALRIAEAVSDELFAIQSQTVLGFIELSVGDVAAADRNLRRLPAWLIERGWNEPTDFAWAPAIEALTGLGELGRADAYLTQYEARARRAGSPWALATAARCRGLLWGARGDPPAAFAAFDDALAQHDRMQAPFERARTLLALASVRRRARQKRATRETLEQALAIFEELGARLWADRARDDLARISGRRSGAADELTESERRVAVLASEGRSNKEIAGALHVTVHTVEAHLSRVYRKLGLRSRAELARRGVGEPAVPPLKTAAKV
jgi:DNA-binding CsgD family transcriptional regulator